MTSPETQPTAQPQPRRRLRISLRLWVALVLALGTTLGWYAHRARVQEQAVSAVKQGGGRVFYDFEESEARVVGLSPPPLSAPLPPWRRWLIDKLGPDWVAPVSAVVVGPENEASVISKLGEFTRLDILLFSQRTSLTDQEFAHIRDVPSLRYLAVRSRISRHAFADVDALRRIKGLAVSNAELHDDDLKHLEHFSSLETLSLSGSKITNAGLAHLSGLTHMKMFILEPSTLVSDLSPIKGFTRLENFHLLDSRIDDPGLAPIANFHSLRFLRLENAPITDAGLAALKNLNNLEVVDLSGTPITSAGLSQLVHLPKLRGLQLDGTAITDAALASLSDFRTLRGLRLSDTAITDAGLRHLRKMPALSDLFLEQTAITDAGLAHLSGMKSLEHISVKGTAVTPAGVSAFQAANPGVRVYR